MKEAARVHHKNRFMGSVLDLDIAEDYRGLRVKRPFPFGLRDPTPFVLDVPENGRAFYNDLPGPGNPELDVSEDYA